MPGPVEARAEEALQLVPEVRAKLLDRVIASLDADRARDAAWDALAATRDLGTPTGGDRRTYQASGLHFDQLRSGEAHGSA